MAYDKNGNWVDDNSGRSMMRALTPNADTAWSSARGLANNEFASGNYGRGLQHLGVGMGGWAAGLMHDINPVTMAIDKMNKTPAQPGFMKVATDVGPGVDRKTGKSTWVDEKDTAKREQIRAQNVGASLPVPQATHDSLPQATYSNEGRGAMDGPLPITLPAPQSQDSIPQPANQDPSKLNWQDMAKQLAAMSHGRAGGVSEAPQYLGGFNQLEDQGREWNDAFDRRRMLDGLRDEMKRAGTRTERAAFGDAYKVALGQMLSEPVERARLAQQGEASRLQAGVTARGQDMNYNAQMAGQGVTSRGQDMNAAAHLATAAMTSEDRRAMNQDNIEANRPLRTAQEESYRSNADVNRLRTEEVKRAAAEGKDPKKMQADMARTLVQEGMKNGMAPEQIIPYWVMMQSASNPDALLQMAQAFKNRKANGGVVGYADGGSVFGDNSQAGLESRLAAMQSMNNGASVDQAYGSGVRGDLYGGWYAGEQPDRNLTGPNDSLTLGGKRTTINDAIAASDARIQPGVHFGYAQGGPIAVGGRQVLGPGTGKSDSIPAVIDGEQPAALSTGEFVMPVEAVQHFGLDRLNKMVAQARKGLDTGRGQA